MGGPQPTPTGILAGWTPGVVLDEKGVAQATALRERLAVVPLTAVVASPLDRTMQTATLMLGDRDIPLHRDERVGECRYGDWTGQPLKVLAKDPLWRVVQAHPSAAVFPGPEGESMPQMQHRAVTAVREWNERLGADAVYAVVSHGDVIKAILADALGMHLDQFQPPARRPVLGQRRQLHAHAPLRPAHERHRQRPVRARPEAQPAAQAVQRRRRRRGSGRMNRTVFVYDRPARFVVGTVGLPGERTFYLQARDGALVTSVALEKAQAAALAERLDALLDQVATTGVTVPSSAPADLADAGPLDLPLDEEFRVGAMALGWDESIARVVVEAYAVAEEDVEVPDLGDDEADGPDTLRVWMTAGYARAFAARTRQVIAAGRPECPFCNEPLDPSGHICPRANGYRRRG